MHIIENYFDVCGFDHRLVQGGTSVYLWNLSRALAARGHRVSVVTPAHGRLADIRQYHDVVTLPYVDSYSLAIPLDQRIWTGFPAEITIPLRTTAHRIAIDNVDIYFLSNDMLDALPDTFYPSYHTKGRDQIFFKPLAFQVDSVRFLREHFAGEPAIVHLHEPYYHYLVPAALRDNPDLLVASTVQSNMPITKKVYRPEVEALLTFLGAASHLPPARPSSSESGIEYQAMSQYQQLTHLHYEYPVEYVDVFELIADHADLIGFLSPGHQEFTATFSDTPFEQLVGRLPIATTISRNAHKRFVGGCALSDSWLAADPAAVDRPSVLGELGLDPSAVTFYHNARYAVNHKGQVELMRAVDRVLTDGVDANFIIRCLSATGIDDPYFHDVARRHHGRVHLEWLAVPEERLFAYAASSDFCLFPSKFEMDTFLIAQGEAMACGAVPIATAQLGMSHFHHVADPIHGPNREIATGFAVRRSFSEDDAGLVNALVDRINSAVKLRRDQPDEYRRLSANARVTARQFSWDRCADEHLAAFDPLHRGVRPTLSDSDALRHGWFDLLAPKAWQDHRIEIARVATALGDVDAYAACVEVSPEAWLRLFQNAYHRADFARCQRLAEVAPSGIELPDLTAFQKRCQVGVTASPNPTWTIHYLLPHAERVELVIPSPADRDRGVVSVYPLSLADDHFTTTVHGAPPLVVPLLVTLPSGRTAWDFVHHG